MKYKYAIQKIVYAALGCGVCFKQK